MDHGLPGSSVHGILHKNTGVGSHFLLQGTFLTQGSNPGLLHWQVDSLPLSHQEAFTFHFYALEKEMATPSSVLAWRIPGMGEPGGLPSAGSHRVGHNWSDLAAAAAAAPGSIKSLFILNQSCLPGGSDSKAFACNARDLGLIPGSGRSPGEENGNPLQYSCLENSIDRGAWWATVLGISKSLTQLSDFTFISSNGL